MIERTIPCHHFSDKSSINQPRSWSEIYTGAMVHLINGPFGPYHENLSEIQYVILFARRGERSSSRVYRSNKIFEE